MASQKSLLVGLTVLVLIILNIDQGCALKCYVCDSYNEKNCTNDFKDKKYQKNCTDKDVPSWVEFKYQIKDSTATPKAATAFECVEIKELKDGNRKNKSGVLRACMPAGLSEKYLKESFSLYNVTISKPNICSKDLCNLSSNIYAGISSLVFSIVLVFLMK